MSYREMSPPKINLSRKPNELPLDVDMEAFFEFSFWMAEELTDLIAEYECREKARRRQRGYQMLADRMATVSSREVAGESL